MIIKIILLYCFLLLFFGSCFSKKSIYQQNISGSDKRLEIQLLPQSCIPDSGMITLEFNLKNISEYPIEVNKNKVYIKPEVRDSSHKLLVPSFIGCFIPMQERRYWEDALTKLLPGQSILVLASVDYLNFYDLERGKQYFLNGIYENTCKEKGVVGYYETDYQEFIICD